MPALSNHRQETFCQLVKRRVPKRRAYVMAGYKPDDGAPYRLSANVRVKARMAELDRYLAMKTRVTVETITTELDEVRAFAEKIEQAGPALNAVVAKAKLHGLMVDRKESGAPGEFSALGTVEEVVAKVRAELGDAAAELLLAQASERPAEPEVEAAPELPTHNGPGTLN